MLVGMTAQTNETANTNQQGIAEDSALSPERAAERAEVLDKAQGCRGRAGSLYVGTQERAPAGRSRCAGRPY